VLTITGSVLHPQKTTYLPITSHKINVWGDGVLKSLKILAQKKQLAEEREGKKGRMFKNCQKMIYIIVPAIRKLDLARSLL
jgi:hypothetical protein